MNYVKEWQILQNYVCTYNNRKQNPKIYARYVHRSEFLDFWFCQGQCEHRRHWVQILDIYNLGLSNTTLFNIQFQPCFLKTSKYGLQELLMHFQVSAIISISPRYTKILSEWMTAKTCCINHWKVLEPWVITNGIHTYSIKPLCVIKANFSVLLSCTFCWWKPQWQSVDGNHRGFILPTESIKSPTRGRGNWSFFEILF